MLNECPRCHAKSHQTPLVPDDPGHFSCNACGLECNVYCVVDGDGNDASEAFKKYIEEIENQADG